MRAPVQFYAVEDPRGDKPVVLRSLQGLDTARMVARGIGGRIFVVDLDTGWTERAPLHFVHVDGAEVRRSHADIEWKFCPEGRVVWETTSRGPWHARWAARRFAVGHQVDERGRAL